MTPVLTATGDATVVGLRVGRCASPAGQALGKIEGTKREATTKGIVDQGCAGGVALYRWHGLQIITFCGFADHRQ